MQEITFYLLLMEGVKVGDMVFTFELFFSFLLFYHFFETKILAMTGLHEKMFWKYFLACESSLIQKKILCFLNQSLKPLSNKKFIHPP